MEMLTAELLINPPSLKVEKQVPLTSVTVHLPEVDVKSMKSPKDADAGASLSQFAKDQMEFVKTMKEGKAYIRQYMLENAWLFRIRLGIALLFVSFYLYCCLCC